MFFHSKIAVPHHITHKTPEQHLNLLRGSEQFNSTVL